MRNRRVTKGVRFQNNVEIGDPVELAVEYSEGGCDELVFYDITASPDGRTVDRSWVNRVAEVLDIPFCVAGGIRSVADATLYIDAVAQALGAAALTPTRFRIGASSLLVDIEATLAGASHAAAKPSNDSY